MKRFIILTMLLMNFSIPVFSASETAIDVDKVNARVEPVLNRLKSSNNFRKNYVFVPKIEPASKNLIVTTNGYITFPSGTLSITENDDLLAAILSMVIVRSEANDMVVNQWKGFVCGLGIVTIPFANAWAKDDFHVADLAAVEYLVKSGYNPLAVEVIVLRIEGDSTSFFAQSPGATKRAQYVHKFIKDNYPEYLSDSNSAYYRKLVYMPCFESRSSCYNVKIKGRVLSRVKKVVKN